MNHSMPYPEPVLEKCINAICDREKTAEDCLALFPEHRASLEPLLHLAEKLQSAKALTAPVDFQLSARQRMETLVRNSPQKIRADTRPLREPVIPREHQPAMRRPGTHGTVAARHNMRMLAIGAVVILSLLIINTTAVLSARALPGGVLFSVKIAAEKAQLFVSSNGNQDAWLHLRFARQRFNELKILIDRGQVEHIAIAVSYYTNELDFLKDIMSSTQITGLQKEQIAKQFMVQIQADERELAAAVARWTGDQQSGISSEAAGVIHTDAAVAMDSIHSVYSFLSSDLPIPPDPDDLPTLIPTTIPSPEPYSRTRTPSPLVTIQPVGKTPVPPVTDPEEGEPEWPINYPTAWPTQWDDAWATLLPLQRTLTAVPIRTLIATYLPPIIVTALPNLPTPPPLPPGWPEDIPDPPEDPGDFPFPWFP